MKRLTLFLLAVGCLSAGCGEGTVKFGGGDTSTPDTIVVEGDLRDINPQVAGANIVVFVFTDLRDPGVFTDFEKQRSVAVAPDSDPMEFRVTRVKSGNLTVVFLQDHVSNPDGSIDVGDPDDPSDDDPYAVLQDPNRVLRGARAGQTIQIAEADIDFQKGTAEAVSLRLKQSVPAR